MRGENTAYNKPAVHFSSECVKKFFETVCTGTLWDIACRLKACCIGGIDGAYSKDRLLYDTHLTYSEMVTSQQEKTLLLKAQLAGLIMAKLSKCGLIIWCEWKLTSTGSHPIENACRRGEPRRMFYSSFDEQITAKYGVIVENWPIPMFNNPSSLSHLEAEVVLRALESGTTRFRSLTDAEWATWRDEYYNSAVAVPAAASQSTADTARSLPASSAFSAQDSLPSMAILAPEGVTDGSETGAAPPASPADVLSGDKRPAELEEQAGAHKKTRTERSQPLLNNYINSTVPDEGTNYEVPVKRFKKRKERSDKGKSRKKASFGIENTQVQMAEATAATAPNAARPKPKPRPRGKNISAETSTSSLPPPPLSMPPVPAPPPITPAPTAASSLPTPISPLPADAPMTFAPTLTSFPSFDLLSSPATSNMFSFPQATWPMSSPTSVMDPLAFWPMSAMEPQAQASSGAPTGMFTPASYIFPPLEDGNL